MTYISHYLPWPSYKINVTPILQMVKLRFRAVKYLAPGHIPGRKSPGRQLRLRTTHPGRPDGAQERSVVRMELWSDGDSSLSHGSWKPHSECDHFSFFLLMEKIFLFLYQSKIFSGGFSERYVLKSHQIRCTIMMTALQYPKPEAPCWMNPLEI